MSVSTTDWQLRRVAIIGAGAMGTSLAALLGKKIPCVVVCRNPVRAANLFAGGARVTGLLESVSTPIVVRGVADLQTVGGVSAIFVTTKTTSIPGLAMELRPLLPRIGDQPGAPYVISYQNGIEPGRQLMEMLGDPRVLRMVLNLGVHLDPATGAARMSASMPPHAIGSVDPERRPVCEAVAAVLTGCGLQTRYEPAIERVVWEKGIINAAVNPVAALVNSSVSQVMTSPARAIVERLLDEGLSVAAGERLGLDAGARGRMLRTIDAMSDHVPSMVEDIRAGHESEIGQLNRQIIEHGRRVGIPTPTHDVIDALIETFDWKLYARGPGAPAE